MINGGPAKRIERMIAACERRAYWVARRVLGTGPVLVGVLSCLVVVMSLIPVRTASAATPVSLELTGWGWCVAYREIGNVSADLEGSLIPRPSAADVEDIYLKGTLSFNLDNVTDSFDLELRGTKVRSLFFLRQVSGGEEPLIAEFEGSWLTDNVSGAIYVACEGRVVTPPPNHVAKPYFLALRTGNVTVPGAEMGGWVEDVDFVIQRCTVAIDSVADRLSVGGSEVKRLLGDVMTQIAVIARGIRELGTPYLV